eukprot:scaffold418802_cov19-Prasinocladus_malaysianus.AAC.1
MRITEIRLPRHSIATAASHIVSQHCDACHLLLSELGLPRPCRIKDSLESSTERSRNVPQNVFDSRRHLAGLSYLHVLDGLGFPSPTLTGIFLSTRPSGISSNRDSELVLQKTDFDAFYSKGGKQPKELSAVCWHK